MTDSMRRYVAEGLGTFALVVVGTGSVMVSVSTHAFGAIGIALAFGLVVTMAVASLGHVSGAHINPAVTVGLWSVGRFDASDVVPYVVAQCAGAVAASVLLKWFLGSVALLGATLPALPVPQSFAIELGATGMLGFVIMGVATDARASSAVAPFAIGATVFAGALVTGPLTGGSFNPARSLGPALVAGAWRAHWLYWIAPMCGMIMGMRAYELVRTAGAPTIASRQLGVEGPIEAP